MSKPKAETPTIKVEFRPGATCEVQVVNGEVPKFCLAKLTRQANGTYTLGVTEWYAHVRMGPSLAKDLGLPFDDNVLYRLIHGGFVRATNPSPGCYIVDLASILEHLEATRVDPDRPSFWTNERRDVYRSAGRRN